MIAVLTDPAVGGTFLTWSLHYLAGHDYYYHAGLTTWQDLPADPVTDRNSHGFRPNQPNNLVEFDRLYGQLKSVAVDGFHTVYFHNFDRATESVDPDLQTAVQHLVNDQLIVLTLAPQHQRYQTHFKSRTNIVKSWTDPATVLQDDQQILDDFIDHFFQDSAAQWREANLTQIWDQREFLALNAVYQQRPCVLPNLDLTRPHYRIDTMELWNTFDVTVDSLFADLGITIDAQRRAQWQLVYQRWQQLHYRNMLFVWYFDTIIDYIVKGHSMDLTRFDLDIIQEAAIQHELIYQHNLNLKTWQLEKFNNTLQLHHLLEPNTHAI